MEHVTARMQRGLKCSERLEKLSGVLVSCQNRKTLQPTLLSKWPSDYSVVYNKHTYIHKSPTQVCTLLETDLWCCSWNLLKLHIYSICVYIYIYIYIHTHIYGRDWKCPLMVTPPTTRLESAVASSCMLPAAGSAPWRAPQHPHTHTHTHSWYWLQQQQTEPSDLCGACFIYG